MSEQKIIAIVGAGPGLGLSIAKRFGREGFRIALISRSQDKLDALVAELAGDQIDAHAFPADVTDDASVAAAFSAIAARLGPIDVLEYSPVTLPASAEDFGALDVTRMTPAIARQSVATMALGAVAAVHAVLPTMLERGQGTILITMGASAKAFMPMIGAWGIASAGVRNYARTLGSALRDKGIYVGAVCLGVQIQKGSETGDPDVLAETYYRLYVERDQPEVFINHFPEGMMELDRG